MKKIGKTTFALLAILTVIVLSVLAAYDATASSNSHIPTLEELGRTTGGDEGVTVGQYFVKYQRLIIGASVLATTWIAVVGVSLFQRRKESQ